MSMCLWIYVCTCVYNFKYVCVFVNLKVYEDLDFFLFVVVFLVFDGV